MGWNTWKVILSPWTLNLSSPSCTLICAFHVARKGLPSMMGIESSSSMSRMMKAAGMTNLPTFTRTFSIIPKDVGKTCPPVAN